MFRRLTLTAIALLALALAAAAPAGAHHVPTKRGWASLRRAVTHSKLVPRSVRRGHFKLRAALISTKGPWAKATIDPRGSALDSVLAVFRHRRHRWYLHSLGTAGVGCDDRQLPKRVRRDLKLRC